MKSTSKDKLSQMHEELDKELEMAGPPLRGKSKRGRQEYRFISELDQNKKSTLSNISNTPILHDYEVRDVEIKTKKNQISELERKLMELQRKMDNFQVSSEGEEESEEENQRLNFKQKIDTRPNEDTARFVASAEEKDRHHPKPTVENPFLDNEESEEDSEDYFEIQKAIQKRKDDQKINHQRKVSEKETIRVGRQSREKKQTFGLIEDTKRRIIVVQTENFMKPQSSKEKSSRSTKNVNKNQLNKRSVRESSVSKKSVEKAKGLYRSNSKGSLKSGQSLKKDNQRNLSREKMNRSMDRSERGQQLIRRDEEVEVTRQLKRVNNLQRELQHYKRLAGKYKQQMQDYKVMEIEFRELKKNFAKSQLIRAQQKKIIDSLKSKINR